jgi:hypothetical protein
MKTFLKAVYAILIFVLFNHCTSSEYPPASTALEAGREFIDGCLKGDFKKASAYMIDDSLNQDQLLKIQRDYNSKNDEEKHAFATASIIINEDAVINDSTHIINYKNSYDQFARKVKVLQRNGKWLVDFKYTFNGNL